MADKFPGYYGATVEHEQRENGSHWFRATLPFPGAPGDRIICTSVGAADDPQTIYEINKRDLLLEAVTQSPPDDKAAWQKRFEEAHKAVRAGQIGRPFAAGQMRVVDAIERLTASGFSFEEAGRVIEPLRAANAQALRTTTSPEGA